jgi:predicted nucleic acid-binding protein
MAGSVYLADSNILIRLVKREHPEYPLVRGAVSALRAKGIRLGYTMQNMAEFWNASTRPIERNGFGLTIEETDENARAIERAFVFLPDNEAVYREWRTLVVRYGVSGAQVHDTRLAAAMLVHGISHILTLNTPDFARFNGIIAIHPNQAVLKS